MSEEVCRDFENGRCNRGNRCKFFHPKLQICKDFQNKGCDRGKCKFLHITRAEEEVYEENGLLPDHVSSGDLQAKQNTTQAPGHQSGHPAPGHQSGHPPAMYGKRRHEDNFNLLPQVNPGLMEENELLKRKITDLQRQIIDLRQMNDTLYDQNTRYRNQLHSSPAATAQVDPYSKTTPELSTMNNGGDLANRGYYDYN